MLSQTKLMLTAHGSSSLMHTLGPDVTPCPSCNNRCLLPPVRMQLALQARLRLTCEVGLGRRGHTRSAHIYVQGRQLQGQHLGRGRRRRAWLGSRQGWDT